MMHSPTALADRAVLEQRARARRAPWLSGQQIRTIGPPRLSMARPHQWDRSAVEGICNRDPVIVATMLEKGERAMRITIVGSGSVARALGGGWMQAGHRVAFAVRDPESASAWLAQALGARLIELEAAGHCTDVVVLAVPWEHVADTLTAVGPLDGVTVIDATNPVVPPYIRLEVSGDDSGAETIQRRIPSARVVKAMNTCGWETMAQPVYAEGRAVMPVAADDAR
jgi:8-hydroxy-5-deazaflavin:NADPH oxidoreductase